jgi:transposase InsO family protein
MEELLARDIRVGKERVQKLMQLHGIRAKGKRRFKVTTDSNHDLPIAPNCWTVSSQWPSPTGLGWRHHVHRHR